MTDSKTKGNQEDLTLNSFDIKKAIGKGTFGEVKLAIHKLTQEKVAIKILEKDKIKDKSDHERIAREIKFLKKLRNINIIKIYQTFETTRQVFIIMEYASGGELFEYIVKKKRVEEKEASFLFSQIIHGLEFMHKHNIVHRDLKPENMLLTEKNTIKIIDFGLSNQYQNNCTLKTPCGSPCYAAPEMILGRKYYGTHVDIWSSGIILFAMVCGYLPFEEKNNDKLYKKILDCKLIFPSHVSNLCKDLIKKLLTVNPHKRITFEGIKKHEFFKLSNQLINKQNLGLNLKKIDNLIVEKMEELGIDRKDIIREVEAHNHNNITTTYELLLNKYLGVGEVADFQDSKDKTRSFSANTKNITSKSLKSPTNISDKPKLHDESKQHKDPLKSISIDITTENNNNEIPKASMVKRADTVNAHETISQHGSKKDNLRIKLEKQESLHLSNAELTYHSRLHTDQNEDSNADYKEKHRINKMEQFEKERNQYIIK